jgi:uroporphyrinogen-III synthase
MEWITTNLDDIWVIITSVVAVASAVAAITPNDKDNAWVAKIKAIVDVLALNVFKAKTKK